VSARQVVGVIFGIIKMGDHHAWLILLARSPPVVLWEARKLRNWPVEVSPSKDQVVAQVVATVGKKLLKRREICSRHLRHNIIYVQIYRPNNGGRLQPSRADQKQIVRTPTTFSVTPPEATSKSRLRQSRPIPSVQSVAGDAGASCLLRTFPGTSRPRSSRPLPPRLVPQPLWVLFSELPVESRARNPPPHPLEHHAGHGRRRRRQQYVSHEFLCHVRPRFVRLRGGPPPPSLYRQ
jgi:hypothetical protein